MSIPITLATKIAPDHLSPRSQRLPMTSEAVVDLGGTPDQSRSGTVPISKLWLTIGERTLTAISPSPNPRDPFAVLRPPWLCAVKVDVDSTSRPEPVSHHRLFVSDVAVRVSEDDRVVLFHDRIEIHHPRGWMGAAARFLYELDSRTYPSFEARVERAHELALTRFPADKIISVALLGTGETRYP